MRRITAAICTIALAIGGLTAVEVVVVQTPVKAQGNDNDYTPLNSRIRRKRQFPNSMINPYRGEIGSATYERSRQMMGRFTRCIYDRSNERALDLLTRTDYGFQSFAQIELENERAARIYGFQDCLRRVAQSFNTGVNLSWTALGLRRWFLEQAYLDRYEDGPDWLQADYVIGPRTYPLSGGNPSVELAMDLADCIVASDPFAADFLFRTESGSEGEARAIEALLPSIQPCLPQGQRVEVNPDTLRTWIGEGLWHASLNSVPPPPEGEEMVETAQDRIRAAMAPTASAGQLTGPEAFADLQRIASCAVENSREGAIAMLLNPQLADPSDGQFNALMDQNRNCIERPTRIDRMVMSGFIAEELLRQNSITIASAMPADFEITSLPLCVAMRGDNISAIVDSLVGQAPGGPQESQAIESIRESWEECAPGAPFQPQLVRGVMTSGLFPLVWDDR